MISLSFSCNNRPIAVRSVTSLGGTVSCDLAFLHMKQPPKQSLVVATTTSTSSSFIIYSLTTLRRVVES